MKLLGERYRFRNYLRKRTEKYFVIVSIFILIELLIITHKLQLLKNTIEKAKTSPITWEWQVPYITPNCWYSHQWYVFKLENCEGVVVGEVFQLIGTHPKVTDTLFLKQIRLNVQAKSLSPAEVSSVKTWFGKLYSLRAHMKAHVGNLLEEHVAQNHQALVLGLLLGDASSLTNLTQEHLKTAGLQHIIAASGYNVGLVISGVTPLIFFVLPKKSSIWMVIFCIWSFVFIAASGPSLLRAGLSATWALISKVLTRSSQAWWSTLMAVVILTLFNPYLWWSISFQFSVAATVGILIWLSPNAHSNQAIQDWFAGKIYPPDTNKLSLWRTVKNYITENISISLAALSLVLPLLIYHFESFSLLSFISSPVVLWVIPAASFASLLLLVAAQSLPQLSITWLILQNFITLPLEILLELTSFLGQFTPAVTEVSISSQGVIWWWSGVLFLYFLWKRRKYI